MNYDVVNNGNINIYYGREIISNIYCAVKGCMMNFVYTYQFVMNNITREMYMLKIIRSEVMKSSFIEFYAVFENEPSSQRVASSIELQISPQVFSGKFEELKLFFESPL